MFGTPVSDMQDDLAVSGNAITGTLKYISTGALANDWGPGYFMALKFTDLDEKATSVKVGLYPSKGSGLVDIIPDPDKNGAFKVTDKMNQKFRVESSDGTHTRVQTFDLSGLTLESTGA